MCGSRKCPHSPHRRDWKFLGEGGVLRAKNVKEMYEVNWNFQRGWGVLGKITSVGEVWIIMELHNT